MKTLILVDIQNDFVDGALAVPDGEEVISVANRLIPNYELVVATQDWHPSNHLSFASQHAGRQVGEQIQLSGLTQTLWPDHCVQGTSGAEFVKALNLPTNSCVFQKGTVRDVDSYSGFFDNGQRQATGLGEFLNIKGVEAIDIMGLATDYCVKFTALDAIKLGFRTRLILNGCRGVELEAGDIKQAVEEMKDAGIVVESL